MKRTAFFFGLLLLSLLFSFGQGRETSVLHTGWKFYSGHNEKASQKDYDDTHWKQVRVPHDWAIEGPFIADGDGNTGKRPWKGEGWYRRKLNIDKEDRGRSIFLLFDGVMAFPEVYVNGRLAGRWDYGYNSFFVDITKFLEFDGKDILAVHADTRKHDSRWYPGAGIYRNVRLIKTDPVHVDIWGCQITTPVLKPDYADVNIAVRICNDLPEDARIRLSHTILKNGLVLTGSDTVVTLPSHSTQRTETTLTLTDPEHWDIDHPLLYQVVTRIYRDGKETDRYLTSFGVRDIRFSADHGFYLNDRRVQLKGVNLHHDLGPLGTAVHPKAIERELEIMKGMGCNAIRTSHNPPAPELLDLCDRMGFLVIDEAFDKYDAKADITDTTVFEDFTERNIRNFILRDRNHPSIILWSVGNEIVDVQWNRHNGFYKLHRMVNTVRIYDPSRPVTLVCDRTESAALRHFDYYDVHAWNYGRRYRLARQLEPNKAVIITESASTLSTRGYYELPLPEKPTDFSTSMQVSSYDLNAPEWAEIPDDDFMWQQEEPYVTGEFVWTGFDYLGEPTPFKGNWLKTHDIPVTRAPRSSYFGIVDLCGIPKDRYFLYKSHWMPEEMTVHILPHWNWPGMEGKEIPVFVYTNGDCAELFLNGKSMGKRCKDPKSSKAIERFRLIWDHVPYAPGEIKAVAYKEGKKTGEATVVTAGKPYSLKITADRDTLLADGQDLSYLLVEAFDKNSHPCPLADNPVQIILKGPGKIAGAGNGNPLSMRSFQSDTVNLFLGKAMVIIGSGYRKGSVKVTVRSPGMQEASSTLTITAKPRKERDPFFPTH